MISRSSPPPTPTPVDGRRVGNRPTRKDGSSIAPRPRSLDEYEYEEVGRPEGPLEDRHVDPYAFEEEESASIESRSGEEDTEFPASGGGEGEPPSASESVSDFTERGPKTLEEESREPRARESGIPYGRRSGRSKRPSRPN